MTLKNERERWRGRDPSFTGIATAAGQFVVRVSPAKSTDGDPAR